MLETMMMSILFSLPIYISGRQAYVSTECTMTLHRTQQKRKKRMSISRAVKGTHHTSTHRPARGIAACIKGDYPRRKVGKKKIVRINK